MAKVGSPLPWGRDVYELVLKKGAYIETRGHSPREDSPDNPTHPIAHVTTGTDPGGGYVGQGKLKLSETELTNV